ncbi:hypothetical protein HMPREF9714_01698 [Myroides odoratimimus CCUG 12901]|uniref:restriction endonuclease subunit S n=1 Tax=Myroides odoratimimus TaxID=76832 RepID=UPI00024616FA|nr:restriction endonuclease subunit S [Myroides odoratimimus]EHO10013.1 hypothetical protein HMPREF9714_01698 [Myroides odoratimimus CCUG 12901]
MLNLRSNITVKDLLEYKLFNTSLPEQTKIADFLTQVDTQISLLADKVAQLQLYKKGVMQKLFSQELRFKDEDGKDYPEWEEKKLGEVADITSSKRVFLSDYVEKGVPFYRGKEISELKKGNQPSDLLYITEESFSIFKEKYGVPQKDDLLITAVGTIGNTYHIPNNDPFYFKDGNLIWLRNIVNHNSIFIEYSLEYSKSEIEKISSGSTQKALTIVKLKVLKVSFPSLPEQTKIANFLTAIDEQIAGVEEQLAQSREFKKGLLQGMFV